MNALTDILSHQVVYKLGWTLLHLLWQGAVVALLLTTVLRLLRKSSANLRYVVACLALASTIPALVVTFCLVSAPPVSAGIESMPVTSLADPLLQRQTTDMPLARAAEYMDMFTGASWTQKVEDFFAPALPYIVAGWVLGVFALSLYHLGGWTHLQRLRRRFTKQADASLLAKLGVLVERLRITRPVRLLESALVQIPTVVGWVRPVILLPATALTGLTSEQIEALLAHELAHIRRGDYLINMLQTVVEILGFYHPAVWWISNKIRLERENCCDDIAVAICGDKMHYATALAEMERIRSSQGELALAANGGNLFTRICRLIGKGSAPKPRFNWAAALIAALLILALAIPTTLAISRRRSTGADDNAAARAPDANNIPPAPPVYVTDANETRVQTLFEFKIFQVSKDSKLIKDADNGNVFVRCDKAFADELVTLSKESKDARVLTAPRVITLEGEEAVMFVGNDVSYTAGYTEQPGKGPKPIMKTVHGGYKIRVKAEVVDNTNIRTDFIFTQTDPTLTTHKVARGQEIQIPLVKTTECSAVVTTGDGGTLFLGGLQDVEKPNQTIIIQLTPRIIRAGQTAPADDSLPNKGSKEEISFTVAPQVVTSIRVDTEGIPAAFSDSRNGPARAVEELIAMLKGQRSLSFELLDSKMAVAGQLDDLRKVVSEQSVAIDSVLSDDKQALIATKRLKDDGGREGQLVFHLTREKDKWTIDDIDFEDPEGLEDEMTRFDEEMRKPREVPVLSEMPGGVRDEMKRFNDRPLKAEPPSTPIDQIVEAPVSLDPKSAGARDQLKPRIYALRHAKAADIAKSLENLLQGSEHKILADVADEASNRLIVVADGPHYQQIESLIAQLDVAAPEETEETTTRVFELRYAEPLELSIVLKSLLKNEQQREVRIVPDSRSNQLIIQGSESDLEQMGKLIEVLDVARAGTDIPAVETVTHIVQLKSADSEQVARLLDGLPTLSEKAKIVADSRLNQLIVQAGESDLQQITQLIGQLDRPSDNETLKNSRSADDVKAKGEQALRTEQVKGLEDQRRQLADKLKALQQKIRQLQREQGMAELTTRQDLMLQRVAGLMNELTKTESRRMQLETDLRLLEQDKDQPLPPQELLKMRQEYVNNDATVRALAEKAAQVEMELLLARQTSTNDSPEVKSKATLLEALKARLEQAKQEVAATFDDLMAKQAAETYRQKLIKAQTELEQNKSYEDRLRERLKEEDAETVRIARIQQEIQLLRDESDSTREMYGEIGRRVMEFQTGLTSPARPGSPGIKPRNSTIEAPPPELKPIPPGDQDK